MLLLLCGPLFASIDYTPLNNVPTAYAGRFRPMDAYARQWLEELISLDALEKSSPLAFLFELHFRGHHHFDDLPLFSVDRPALKSLLQLEPSETLFSYRALRRALSDLKTRIDKNLDDEIKALGSKLDRFAQFEGSADSASAKIESLASSLRTQGIPPAKISQQIEMQYPAAARLENSGPLFAALPSKRDPARWLPLKALKLKNYSSDTNTLAPISNFTAYNSETFDKIQKAYINLEKAATQGNSNNEAKILADALMEGFAGIEGKPYRNSIGKTLYFPSTSALKLENFYYHSPFAPLAIAGYLLASILFIARKPKNKTYAFALLGAAFLLQSACLCLRCAILLRPPVSNMYETLLFVPWITLLTSGILYYFYRTKLLLSGSSLCAALLLSIMQWGGINNSLDNVQPVLDSQYWLVIHVLMVVGSYGVFILGGIIGHIYLAATMIAPHKTAQLKTWAMLILQSMYIGTALLVPGTILGGVWAAESWGRFWDWDPKESWAFISICTYLIWIHAYLFGKINDKGLAIGSIVGLMVISFTWYGVNYILGTGLHSYGFGSGGTIYFLLYLLAEVLFLAFYAGKNYYKRPSSL